MQRYKNIFIVLTYINSNDLVDFLESLVFSVDDYKVIVVNSYHDEESKEKIKNIALRYNCDFLNVENKGYSYGNNRGIEYALTSYYFDFLTVSNADIVVNMFSTKGLPNEGIFAANLIAKNGKVQNPMLVKENKLSERLIYKGFKNGKKINIILGVGINKVKRIFFLMKFKKYIANKNNNSPYIVPIFQPHGSFITFSYKSIKKLWNGEDVNYVGVFDENVFLFSEEGILAKRAKCLDISIYFSDFAVCYHKEDGSMKLSKIDMNGELKKSNIYYYEYYGKR